MAGVETQTVYRRGFLTFGCLALVTAVVLLGFWLFRDDVALGGGVDRMLLAIVGWGTPVVALSGIIDVITAVRSRYWAAVFTSQTAFWWIGAVACWLTGWLLVAGGIRSKGAADRDASPAVGSQLHPTVAELHDFHWGTAAMYGGGILLAEISLLLLHTLLASRAQIPAPAAFSISFAVGCAVAFIAGFLGTSRARRISVPEAALALIYFGLPAPVLLTVLQSVSALQHSVGHALREVIYLAELLGRPELGYWLVFVGLSLAMILGITSGFVATGSGRADLKTGFELFIAKRHVSLFRPRFLLGALVVLMLFIVPPLLVFGILMATERTVERTRIRALGLKDPLLASEALNQLKMNELSPTTMMTSLSVGGVGLGVMALIIVLSVMSGFEADLKEKILGTNAHILISKYGEDFEEYKDVMKKIREVPGVVGESPIILNEVMISSDHNISGAVIKGIDPKTVGDVTDLPKNILKPGKLDYLEHPQKLAEILETDGDGSASKDSGKNEPEDPIIGRRDMGKAAVLPGILLGNQLAGQLRVKVGDKVKVVSPLAEELGPRGPTAKLRPFRVAGIFHSGMYEYDSKFVYIPLKEAQSFFNVKGVTMIELKVADIDEARNVARAVGAKLDGYPYRARHWGEMNQNLFSALRLEKLVMGIILTIMVIVAAGLIVATVIMLVLEKRKEIAILKALGVSDAGVVKIFLAEGLQIGIAGGVLGLGAGLAGCLFIEKVGINLDPEIYYISALPVKIDPAQTAIAVLIAILTTYLASIYPALKASRVEPVEGLKAE